MKWKFLSLWKAYEIISENEELKRNLHCIENDNNEYIDRIHHLENKLKSCEDAAMEDCKIGNHCESCVYGNLIHDSIRMSYGYTSKKRLVCSYNDCKHFELKKQDGE